MVNRLLVLFVCMALGTGVVGCRSNGEVALVQANEEAVVVSLPMDQAWETVRDALLEKEYNVYTRDKRGLIIGYTPMKRKGLLVPHRTKFTIVLEDVTNETTQISIETIHQQYRVTFLTYPRWHDMETFDDKELGHDLLMSVEALAEAVSGS
ncbi:MAG: hypothetical protein COA73_15710 [Candidatus Hydrogenedentota bacterium]|nr:MAG: hypothetical protein COA73_15710 [Candidatus Hydrogenedentota bacterium]